MSQMNDTSILSTRRCGRSGLHLPVLTLGCWYNFGEADAASSRPSSEEAHHANCTAIVRAAFERGINHIDLANQYGPPIGGAEERVGRILKDWRRDDWLISSKAGAKTDEGPYGKGGSRRLLLNSLEASLRRLQTDYLDLFYLHGPDIETDPEETWSAMADAVRSGKVRYLGVSMHQCGHMARVIATCERHGFPKPVISIHSYNMLNRSIEAEQMPMARLCEYGLGAFCSLGQGLLTSKYLQGIPDQSRANQGTPFFSREKVKPAIIEKLRALQDVATARGQSLSQLALAWILRKPEVATALIGASRPEQINENAAAVSNLELSDVELQSINTILN